ncbi:MAG: 30S ribosomal protein S16 [Bacteroidia bacterium]|nr:30S ribosomal protein S16 [Bacteroidia bacterium]
MPAKIRLQRHGKKGNGLFHIVVADGRAPRDGKLIERIGTYNPNTNPATIDINSEKALTWLKNGAQPTDTCRAILSYKGILYRQHLQGGVAKGAFSQEEADKRFEKWMNEKQGKIDAKRGNLASSSVAEAKKRFEAEKARKEAVAQKVAEKTSALAAEAAAAAAAPAAEEAPAAEAAENEAPAAE